MRGGKREREIGGKRGGGNRNVKYLEELRINEKSIHVNSRLKHPKNKTLLLSQTQLAKQFQASTTLTMFGWHKEIPKHTSHQHYKHTHTVTHDRAIKPIFKTQAFIH